jgi:predicted Fe-Mo cluster-binding NifX family protein
MKIAVPLFGEEVSPRFGFSTQLLVANIDEAGVQVEGIQELANMRPWQWPDYLATLGIEKLICGGMHPRFQVEMQRRGIEVIWGVIGPVADALEALRDGTLQRDQFLRRGRRGRRGRGWDSPARPGGDWSGPGGRGPGGGPGRGRGSKGGNR